MITQPDRIPANLRRFEAKIDGPLWLEVIDALPRTLAEPLAASVKSSEPSNSAIKQHIANRYFGKNVTRSAVFYGDRASLIQHLAEPEQVDLIMLPRNQTLIARIFHDSLTAQLLER